ncbi:MAG: hypothetical protein DYH07_13290 [Armatimonadetes bacterium ATM1]|nr:hypothetical protein [Armatimonadetes bacterium ATM1]
MLEFAHRDGALIVPRALAKGDWLSALSLSIDPDTRAFQRKAIFESQTFLVEPLWHLHHHVAVNLSLLLKEEASGLLIVEADVFPQSELGPLFRRLRRSQGIAEDYHQFRGEIYEGELIDYRRSALFCALVSHWTWLLAVKEGTLLIFGTDDETISVLGDDENLIRQATEVLRSLGLEDAREEWKRDLFPGLLEDHGRQPSDDVKPHG